jgi:hypothetical protein
VQYERFFSDRNSELSIKYWSDPLGRTETDLLEESIQLLAMRVLRQNDGGPHG